MGDCREGKLASRQEIDAAPQLAVPTNAWSENLAANRSFVWASSRCSTAGTQQVSRRARHHLPHVLTWTNKAVRVHVHAPCMRIHASSCAMMCHDVMHG
eukprot:365237-Chlamydomonas_euryale.AAC.9